MIEKNCEDCDKKIFVKTDKPKCCFKCRDKKYYLKNRQKRIDSARKWELANPEKARISHKKSMKKYVESGKMKAKMNEYYHSDKNDYKLKSRTKHLTQSYRNDILSYFGNACAVCESEENLEIHHSSYTLAKGQFKAEERIEELIAIVKVWCRDCHRKHHQNTKLI